MSLSSLLTQCESYLHSPQGDVGLGRRLDGEGQDRDGELHDVEHGDHAESLRAGRASGVRAGVASALSPYTPGVSLSEMGGGQRWDPQRNRLFSFRDSETMGRQVRDSSIFLHSAFGFSPRGGKCTPRLRPSTEDRPEEGL